mmetsp:Transcript_11544/g.34544  ORF Transcript_11544/g.34544 Transcript_11544/m.34544 type:complete len:324 (-) Transcript_11544:810-1781(-)
MQRLHSEIDPAFFSNSFKPMNHLVKVLSAEARQRQKNKLKFGEEEQDVVKERTSSDSEEEEEEAVKILTIEGRVVRVLGLTPSSSVEDLRKAVEEKTGSTDVRLFLDSAHLDDLRNLSDLSTRLEPLRDGAATLGDLGVFTENVALHLRNREYESLRHQVRVATDVLETVLEDHYDAFQENFERVRKMAAEFDAARAHVAVLKARVLKTRKVLGLPESRVFAAQKGKKHDDDDSEEDSDDDSDDATKRGDDDSDRSGNEEGNDFHHGMGHGLARRRGARLIDVYEKKAEQDEVQRVIHELRRNAALAAAASDGAPDAATSRNM